MRCRQVLLAALLLCSTFSCWGQAQNGKLQIHHLDVGQGDATLVISPNGETALVDMGADLKRKNCAPAMAYMDQLGVTQINYLFISHYHYDHIGCVPAVLKKFPLVGDAYDRGQSYTGSTYVAYTIAVKRHRKTATIGTTITLDTTSAVPVEFSVIAVNGKSKIGTVSTKNENDLSLAVLLSFGAFREEIGGDLSGKKTTAYQDVETPVAKDIGALDVYKVHHHCSSYSTNATWIAAIQPTIAIISTGDGNGYHHPAPDCVDRLHAAGLQRIYWTERGNGAPPSTAVDFVSGDTRIQVSPNASTYDVSYRGSAVSTFRIKAAPPDTTPSENPAVIPGHVPLYAWSKKSKFYHEATCPDVQKILPENLVRGDSPPPDKTPSSCIKR